MKNNLVYFKTNDKNDKIIKFVANGGEVEFSTEKDKTMSQDNRSFIVQGLNHLLEWAFIKDKKEFLNKFAIFILYLKSTLTSSEFKEAINNKMKQAIGKNEIENVKGDLYAEKFSEIDNVILMTILEYVDENIVYNSNTHIKNPLPSDVPNLIDNDIYILGVIIVLSKIITLGAILLGNGKISSLTVKAIIATLNRISYSTLPNYFYTKGYRERFDDLQNLDLHNNIYIYLRDITLGLMENNKISTELTQSNGRSPSSLLKEIIDYSLAIIFKCNPINLENEKTGEPYYGENHEKYKFTSRNIISYMKTIIKNNHKNKNLVVKHTNVVKNKRLPEDSPNNNSVAFHKSELLLEKRDVKDLQRRKEHIKILENYVNKYLEKHNIIDSDYDVIKTALSDFFVIRVLKEISEDYVSLKIINTVLYKKIVLMISHLLQDNYLVLSLALKSSEIQPKTLIGTDKTKFDEMIQEIDTYYLDPVKFSKSFYSIISVDYLFKPSKSKLENGAEYSYIYIGNDFLRFLIEDQDNKFKFIKDYIYNYEE